LAASTLDGAAGTLIRALRFSLAGPTPCRIEGRPTVVPLAHGRAAQVQVRAGGWRTSKVRPVLVTAKDPLFVTVTLALGGASSAETIDGLQVTVAGRTVRVDGFGTGGGGRTAGTVPVEVGPYTSLNPPTVRHTSPYDDVTAAGDLDLTARADQPLNFAVTLTSKHDLPLDPCPDYTILTSAGESSYALDCAAVPHRDAQGRPYLPSGVPVTFAMRADPGRESTPKFLWQLTTPRSAHVLVAGLLTVTD
jgi:hypothetical protein